MSRLIVKNLSSNITADTLKKKFSHHGTVTDVKLMFTKVGKFRRFAFVGFQSTNEAEKAKAYLDKSMMLNQRITVETCRDFGVQEKIKSKENEAIESTESIKEKKESANEPLVKSDPQKDISKSDLITENPNIVSDFEFLQNKKESGLISDDDLSEDECVDVNNIKNENVIKNDTDIKYIVKMRGCPFKVKDKQIQEFFYPLKPFEIKMQTNEHGSRTGTVFVSFSSEKDQIEALKHNGDYINKRYIELFKQTFHNKDNHTKLPNNGEKAWMKKVMDDHKDCEIEDISESGRIFVRNLSFACTEDDLKNLFEKYGPLNEINIPIDSLTRKGVGFGFITFMMPEHALKAFNELDGTAFQGRMLHILPAKAKAQNDDSNSMQHSDAKSSYKKNKAAADKKLSQSSHNWNALFMGTNAVADAIAEKYTEEKSVVLDSTKSHSAAVRLALGETQLVNETRDFLIENGISLDAFSQPNAERSKTVILAKNLPAGSTSSELRNMFEKHAQLGRVVLAPAGITAVIECLEPSEARNAFMKLAYRKFHHTPLYLEWAPVGTFVKGLISKEETPVINSDVEQTNKIEIDEQRETDSVTLFVKNLNFNTTDENLKKHFLECGPLLSATISRKKTHKTNALLSMGYGFVTFKHKKDGKTALKNLQHSMLDNHKLELKLSERKQPINNAKIKKNQINQTQVSSKILVRNIPFQANNHEIRSLFKSFGELKTVRLPKKLNASLGKEGRHRGFAFVDFLTKEDAKNAFEALCHSTHLYGRRLVLEWADTEESSIEALRRKTSDHFHGNSKKRKGLSSFEESLASTPVDSD